MQTPEKTPRMKMPLKFGIPLLIALWLASGFMEYGQGKTLLMALAMGVALWTAFSLPRPRRRRPEEPEEPEEDPPLKSAPSPAAGDTTTPTNGSGRPISRSGKHTEIES